MDSESLEWWMSALRSNVYIQIYLVAAFILIFGVAIMLPDVPYRTFLVLTGMIGTILGIVSCIGSGVVYDRLNTRLQVAIRAEKKELKKYKHSKQEGKDAEGQKTN